MKQQKKPKDHIISEVSQNTYLSVDVVRDVVNEFLRVIRREIVETGRMTIPGIFSVRTMTKKAHRRRSVKTGEMTDYPASEYLAVALSKSLRDEFQMMRRTDSPVDPGSADDSVSGGEESDAGGRSVSSDDDDGMEDPVRQRGRGSRAGQASPSGEKPQDGFDDDLADILGD